MHTIRDLLYFVFFVVWHRCYFLGLPLLAWINLNHSMPNRMWEEITYPFPNSNGYTAELLEMDITPHIIMDVITYPCIIQVNLC